MGATSGRREVTIGEQFNFMIIPKRQVDLYGYNGMTLLLDDKNMIDHDLIHKPDGWEGPQLRYLDEVTKSFENSDKKTIFLDIGSHWGLYSLVARSLGRFSKQVAFEPENSVFAQLQANLFLNKAANDIKVIKKAVSNKCGTAQFINSASMDIWNKGGGSIVPDEENEQEVVNPTVRPLKDKLETYEVETTTIDTEVKDRDALIFAKIDVEYHERSVLKGMENLLRNNGVVLQIEVWDPKAVREKHNCVTYADIRQTDIYKFLEKMGYRLIKTIPPDYYFTNIR